MGVSVNVGVPQSSLIVLHAGNSEAGGGAIRERRDGRRGVVEACLVALKEGGGLKSVWRRSDAARCKLAADLAARSRGGGARSGDASTLALSPPHPMDPLAAALAPAFEPGRSWERRRAAPTRSRAASVSAPRRWRRSCACASNRNNPTRTQAEPSTWSVRMAVVTMPPSLPSRHGLPSRRLLALKHQPLTLRHAATWSTRCRTKGPPRSRAELAPVGLGERLSAHYHDWISAR